MAEKKRKSKPNLKKAAIIDQLKERLDRAQAFFLTDYRGLTHQQLESLRKILRKIDAELVVAKNTLMKISIDNCQKKKELEDIKKELENPTATFFAYGDAIEAIKKLATFTKDFSLPKVKIGFFDGNITDSDTFNRLASLPSHDVLLSTLVARLKSPLYGLHYALNWNMQRLVMALHNIKNSKH